MGQLLAELRGAADAAEVPLQVLCSLSLQYEAAKRSEQKKCQIFDPFLIHSDHLIFCFCFKICFVHFLLFLSSIFGSSLRNWQ